FFCFFFSSRRRHTRWPRDWSSDVCSSDLDGGPLSVSGLVLWPEKRHVEWQGRSLELTGTEFNVLEVLMRNAGRVVSKKELSEQRSEERRVGKEGRSRGGGERGSKKERGGH